MSTGTVEERIDEMIVEKRKLADDLLAGDAEVNLTELSDEALMGPVRLARISHQVTAADANMAAFAALNAARVLDVLYEYACAPGLAFALQMQPSSRPRSQPGEKCGLDVTRAAS